MWASQYVDQELLQEMAHFLWPLQATRQLVRHIGRGDAF